MNTARQIGHWQEESSTPKAERSAPKTEEISAPGAAITQANFESKHVKVVG